MTDRLTGYDIVAAFTENTINGQLVLLKSLGIIRPPDEPIEVHGFSSFKLTIEQLGIPQVNFCLKDSNYHDIVLCLPIARGRLESLYPACGENYDQICYANIKDWVLAFKVNMQNAPIPMSVVQSSDVTTSAAGQAIRQTANNVHGQEVVDIDQIFDIQYLFMDFEDANLAEYYEEYSHFDFSDTNMNPGDAKNSFVTALTKWLQEYKRALFIIGSGFQSDLDQEKFPDALRQDLEGHPIGGKPISFADNIPVTVQKVEEGRQWVLLGYQSNTYPAKLETRDGQQVLGIYKGLEFLFGVDPKFQSDLQQGTLSADFKQAFANHGISFSPSKPITISAAGNDWHIVAWVKQPLFSLVKEGDQINVYRGFSNPWILGYALHPRTQENIPASQLPTFVPTNATFSTYPNDEGLGTLNWLFVTGWRDLPTANQAGIFETAWVTDDDTQGTMALDRSLIIGAQALPPLAEPWHMKASDFGDHDTYYKINAKTVSGFQDDGDKEYSKLNDGQLTITVQSKANTNELDITYHYQKVREAKALGIIPDGTYTFTADWTMTFYYHIDGHGQVTVTHTSSDVKKETDVKREWWQYALDVFPWFVIGDLIETLRSISSFPNVDQGIWNVADNKFTTVLPGGDIFAFKDVRLDEASNLLATLTYSS